MSARKFFFALALFLLINACAFAPATPTRPPIEQEVKTLVASTLSALTATPSPTATPLPSPTEAVPPSPTFIFPTFSPPIVTPNIVATPKPDYSCDIINQRPYDDTKFHPKQSFVIKWTLVNNGAKKWKANTYLNYQTGPRMTSITSILVQQLKPGESYEITLGATAPAEKGRQVMVWVVFNTDANDNSTDYLCYPYVRIIVSK